MNIEVRKHLRISRNHRNLHDGPWYISIGWVCPSEKLSITVKNGEQMSLFEALGEDII